MQAVTRPRAVHYVGLRHDRFRNAYRIFGGPRTINRRWDFLATRGDTVVFAKGDKRPPEVHRTATDLDARRPV